MQVKVIGGGLAGCEAAWQCLRRGLKVELVEMRPTKLTPAHQTGNLAELVCSNSLKSLDKNSAPGLLKEEMQALGSLIVMAALKSAVPAGQALAVDREKFSQTIRDALFADKNFTMTEAEYRTLPDVETLSQSHQCIIVATGPLTSDDLMPSLLDLCGNSERLHFYDAIAPIIAADSIDFDHCYKADRYGKGDADYLNIPLDKSEYEAFIKDILTAEYALPHGFENAKYFESCLPIEVMAHRGTETLRFGPMKPVGLPNPKTGQIPHAVIQMRQENIDATMYSLVGFQSKMKWPEQKRVFSRFPALRNAEFLRFGSIHRNTFLESPKVLNRDLSFQNNPHIFLAGQITGVEGYTESSAMGLLAGQAAAARLLGEVFSSPPRETMIGSLWHYITQGGLGEFQPMNANFGLLPPLPRVRKETKPERKIRQCSRASEALKVYSAPYSDSHI